MDGGDESIAIPGALNIALTIIAAATCCALLWLASHGTLWQIAFAAIAFSYVNNTMFSLLHESVHGIAHRNRAINEWIGRFAAAFFPTSFSIQRICHMGHHARNRTLEEQFDYIHPSDHKLLKGAQWYSILTGLYWLFVPIGAIVYAIWPGIVEQPWLTSRDSNVATQTGGSSILAGLADAPVWRVRLELLFAIAIQSAMFVAFDLRLIGWLACYAAFAINWSSLQYADHAFSELDVRNGAWNLRVTPIARAFFLNYHHHRAHHQNPHIPWLHLGRFVGNGEPRPLFWRVYFSMWRGPRLLP